MKSMTVKFPDQLHKTMRIYCFEKGISIQDYLLGLAKKDLEKNAKGDIGEK